MGSETAQAVDNCSSSSRCSPGFWHCISPGRCNSCTEAAHWGDGGLDSATSSFTAYACTACPCGFDYPCNSTPANCHSESAPTAAASNRRYPGFVCSGCTAWTTGQTTSSASSDYEPKLASPPTSTTPSIGAAELFATAKLLWAPSLASSIDGSSSSWSATRSSRSEFPTTDATSGYGLHGPGSVPERNDSSAYGIHSSISIRNSTAAAKPTTLCQWPAWFSRHCSSAHRLWWFLAAPATYANWHQLYAPACFAASANGNEWIR